MQSASSLCVYLKDDLAWPGGFFLQDWHNQERGWGLDFFPFLFSPIGKYF